MLLRLCGRAAAGLTNYASVGFVDAADVRASVTHLSGPRTPYAPEFCPPMYNPQNPVWVAQQQQQQQQRPRPGVGDGAPRVVQGVRPNMVVPPSAHSAAVTAALQRRAAPVMYVGVTKQRGGYRAQFIHNQEVVSYVRGRGCVVVVSGGGVGTLREAQLRAWLMLFGWRWRVCVASRAQLYQLILKWFGRPPTLILFARWGAGLVCSRRTSRRLSRTTAPSASTSVPPRR